MLGPMALKVTTLGRRAWKPALIRNLIVIYVGAVAAGNVRKSTVPLSLQSARTS
jgi:hypothetical protein